MNAISRSGLRYSRLQSRLLLLWLCPRAVVLAPLCRNILREVCAYLVRFQMLARCVGTDLLIVDIYSRTGLKISTEVKPLYTFSSVVAVDYMKLVLCGGMSNSETSTIPSSVFLYDNAVFSSLCDMNDPGYCHSLVYVESEHAVFAIGGVKLGYRALSSCEKYSLATDSWTTLPQLIGKRIRPLVAQHGDSLYVCGGLSNTCMERFDMRRSEWIPIYEPAFTHGIPCFFLACENSLLMLGNSSACRFNLDTQTWCRVSPLQLEFFFANCSAVVNGLAFLLTEKQLCVCVDLESGLRKPELEFEIGWKTNYGIRARRNDFRFSYTRKYA